MSRATECTGKRAFATKEQAKRALRRWDLGQGNARRSELHAYRCSYCDAGFHVGHKQVLYQEQGSGDRVQGSGKSQTPSPDLTPGPCPLTPGAKRLHCTEDTGRRILRIAKGCLERYWGHPMYDDLLSYAVLTACQTLSRMDPAEHNQAFGIVAYACGISVKVFFNSQQCDLAFRFVSERGHEIPRPVPWHELEERSEDPQSLPFYRAVVPDFVPALLQRLWEADVLRELWSLLDEPQRAIAARWAQGSKFETVGEELGLSREKAQRLFQSGLNEYRQRYGLPLRKDGRWRYSKPADPQEQEVQRAKWRAQSRERAARAKARRAGA